MKFFSNTTWWDFDLGGASTARSPAHGASISKRSTESSVVVRKVLVDLVGGGACVLFFVCHFPQRGGEERTQKPSPSFAAPQTSDALNSKQIVRQAVTNSLDTLIKFPRRVGGKFRRLPCVWVREWVFNTFVDSFINQRDVDERARSGKIPPQD